MNNTTILVKELRQDTGAGFLECKKALMVHEGDYEQAAAFLRKKNLNKAAKKADRQTTEGLIVVKANEDAVGLVELNCETDFVALTPDFKTLTHGIADLVLADETLTDVVGVETAASAALSAGVFSTTNQTIQHAIQSLIGKLGENMKLGQVARYATTDDSVVHGYVHAGAISGYDQNEGRLGVLVEVAFGDKTAVSHQTATTIAHDLALHIASAVPKFVSVADIPTDVLAQQQNELWAEVAAINKPDAIKKKMVAGRLNKFYQQNCLLAQPFLKDDSLTVADWLQGMGDEVGTAVSVTRFTRTEIAG